MAHVGQLAYHFPKWSPDDIIAMPTLSFLGWWDVLEDVLRKEASRQWRVEMAGNQMQMETEGLREFQQWLAGQPTEKIKQLEQSFQNLHMLCAGFQS